MASNGSNRLRTPAFHFPANSDRIMSMSTLHLSDTLLDSYVALFHQLAPRDQTILLNKLTETVSTDSANADDTEKRNNLIRDVVFQDVVYQNEGHQDVVFLPEPPDDLPLEELAGSCIDDRSAEEIVADLRQSRTPNLDRVNL